MRSTGVDLMIKRESEEHQGGFDVFKESLRTTRLAVMATVVV